MTITQFVCRVVFVPISLRWLYVWLLPTPRIRRTPFRWIGKCECGAEHLPGCYAGRAWYEIGMTFHWRDNRDGGGLWVE